jgi:hypothetical protein
MEDNSMKSIYKELYEYYKEQKSKIAQKVFDVLNREGIAGIILDKNVFWFESYNRGNSCPLIVYEHIKQHLKKQGYIYLYDLR